MSVYETAYRARICPIHQRQTLREAVNDKERLARRFPVSSAFKHGVVLNLDLMADHRS